MSIERERVILASPSYEDLKSIVDKNEIYSSIIDTTDYGTVIPPSWRKTRYPYYLDIKENNKSDKSEHYPFITMTIHPGSGGYMHITPTSYFIINKSQSSYINIWEIYDTYSADGYFDAYPSLRPKFIIEENTNNNYKISLKDYIKENYKEIYNEYIEYLR